jgi:hypothetical protein
MAEHNQSFGKMARIARRDTAPQVDVSHLVIHRLELMAEESIDRPLAWLTVGSMATATALGGLAFSMYGTLSDPMGVLFQVTPMLGH